jgi:hypothetical protein
MNPNLGISCCFSAEIYGITSLAITPLNITLARHEIRIYNYESTEDAMEVYEQQQYVKANEGLNKRHRSAAEECFAVELCH